MTSQYEDNKSLINEALQVDRIEAYEIKSSEQEIIQYYNNIVVKNYEFIGSMIVGETLQVGVRFINNNQVGRSEVYLITLFVYEGSKLIRSSVTDWNTNKILAGSTQYFMWSLNNLPVGSYTLYCRMMDLSQMLMIGDFALKSNAVDPDPEEGSSPIYDDIRLIVDNYLDSITDPEEKDKARQLVANDLVRIANDLIESIGGDVVDPVYNVLSYGAIPNDGKPDNDAFTRTFNAAGNNEVIIPEGTFNLPWDPSSTFYYNRIMTCTGTGRISIDNFPQPGNPETGFNENLINPLYKNGFGRFNMPDVHDDVFMSMNMLHEHRSVIDMYHQNYAGVKTRHDFSSSYPKLVPWGACVLRLDKLSAQLPNGNVSFNIGKFGVMIYRKSTQQWEFQSNPFAEGGGFFKKNFDGSTIALTRTINKEEDYVTFTVPINKTKDYVVHFWAPGWVVSNPTDIQYAIVFGDVWLDSKTPNLEDYFVFNFGMDMKTTNNAIIREFMTGRFIDITYQIRRNFNHNIMEPYYKEATGGGANINKLINAKSYSVDY